MSGSTQNPYNPPRSDTTPDSPLNLDPSNYEVASRIARLFGALVDGFLDILTICIGIWISGGQVFMNNSFRLTRSYSEIWWYTLPLSIIQALLIARTGQSIGKRIARTRIVKLDGSRATFFSAVVLRWWVPSGVLMLPTMLTKVGINIPNAASLPLLLLWIADMLAIFGPSRRCLHDLIAGTKVLNAD